ncbi:alkaline phosphatase family protein [Deminuibacter soli]|uniref:Alkaline phosphatase family protein n=1 Tax=Deminuibacter soli TaxID=2291815 RepID=A0A3E1NGF1_9BACT|nr:ectonucleotide pyrophosphatase/phosphodiesterase [Deminuibacter soli]RFM27046.1 alkaline phosphatase family protein [Deminuibacter soli]
MKKFILSLLLLPAVSYSFAQQATHVVLITIDGFRPDFYQDASWGAFNLRMLADSGVRASAAVPVFPSVTYPDHTTIVTGVAPAKHGVYYNAPFEPQGASGVWYFDYNAIKVPTLWDAVHKAGKTSANVIWPVTVGAPIDYNVPDIWVAKGGSDRLAITAKNTTPAGLWQELQDKATGTLQPDDFAMVNDELIMDENVGRMSAYIIQQYKPGFTALHLACCDHYEHAQGRDGSLVRKAVAGADRAIGDVLEAVKRAGIKDSTVIIVTGDHGFVNISHSFAPNVLLAQNGLLKDVKTGDWKAQFYSAGGSAFLHLKDKNDKATLNKVVELLKQLPAAEQQYFKIIDQQALTQSGADPAAVLAVTGLQGTTFSNATDGKMVKPAKGGTHGFYPDFNDIKTGFVISGKGVRKGSSIGEIHLTDVAPVVAQVLGLDFKGTDGHVPDGMLN